MVNSLQLFVYVKKHRDQDIKYRCEFKKENNIYSKTLKSLYICDKIPEKSRKEHKTNIHTNYAKY